jgi:hypothetical protein
VSSPVGHICPTFPMDCNHGLQQQQANATTKSPVAAAAADKPATDQAAEPGDRAGGRATGPSGRRRRVRSTLGRPVATRTSALKPSRRPSPRPAGSPA